MAFFMEKFEEITNDFLAYLKLERGLSENTLINYKYDLHKFLRFLAKEINEVNEIEEQHVRAFVYTLNDQYSPLTQSRILSSLSTFFSYLLLDEKIDANPMQFIEHPKTSRKLPVFLTLEEIELILDQIDRNTYEGDRNYVILDCLYSFGLRVSELTSLRMSDVFFDEGFIRIFGKGNKERLVPMAPQTKDLLISYIKYTRPELVNDNFPTDVLFLNRRGKPLTRAMIFTVVKNASRLTGITKEVSPHTFRHSFATHLLENGANLFAIQSMLGHESVTTTEIYVHVEKSALKKIIEDFHPWVKQQKEA